MVRDMWKKITGTGVALLAAMMLWGCTKGQNMAEPAEVITLTLANNHPEDYCTTAAVEWFAKKVEDRTEGRVVIDVYNSGKLGDTVSCLE